MTENMTLTRIDYPEIETQWQTPKGHPATLIIRANTNDWNTANSIMTADEYGLRALDLVGTALDVGAYSGGWSIAAALDNPDLNVIAVEAIGENAELTRRNVELNGLADRVWVMHKAAAAPGIDTADVFWRAQGNDMVEHHAFVGNSSLVYEHGDINHETETIDCVDLAAFGPIDYMKIDCEGCEWGFLASPAIADVKRIIGEWHPTGGHTAADIVALLDATHDVTVSGIPEGPGAFEAVRRG